VFNWFDVVEQVANQLPAVPSLRTQNSICSSGDSVAVLLLLLLLLVVVVVAAVTAIIGYRKNRRVVTIRMSYSGETQFSS
jgi:hypothetical protein